MAETYNFRQANSSDLDYLLRSTTSLMNHESLESALELPLKDNIDTQLNNWLKSLLDSDNALFIIAEDENNNTQGFILGLIQLAPNDFLDIGVHGLIQMLWVEPDKRRAGLAAQLVSQMEDTFKNLNIKYCEISYSHSNIEASTFWEKSGYSPVSHTSRKFLT